MKKLFIAIVLNIFCFSALCEDVNKGQVSNLIDQFVEKGILTKEQAIGAKGRLGNVSDEEWKKVNKSAALNSKKMKSKYRKSASLSVDDAAEGIDTESPEFKRIQKEMGSILHKHKDPNAGSSQ
ncbi:MAG: hypothetical protein HOE90_04650 [Bacteriovoracaceae bacterium]|jgi:hypothetical protein|nr:hypothetical protein [Bacteriovoracaceae bacterium]